MGARWITWQKVRILSMLFHIYGSLTHDVMILWWFPCWILWDFRLDLPSLTDEIYFPILTYFIQVYIYV